MPETHRTWLHVCFNGNSIDTMSDKLSMEACWHCCSLLPTEGHGLPHVRPEVLQAGWHALHEGGVHLLQGTRLAIHEVSNYLYMGGDFSCHWQSCTLGCMACLAYILCAKLAIKEQLAAKHGTSMKALQTWDSCSPGPLSDKRLIK